jgi:hypothetical protein
MFSSRPEIYPTESDSGSQRDQFHPFSRTGKPRSSALDTLRAAFYGSGCGGRATGRRQLGRPHPWLRGLQSPARGVGLRGHRDVRAAVLAPSRITADLIGFGRRCGQCRTGGLGVDGWSRDRCHPVVCAGRPHRPGEGDLDLGHRRHPGWDVGALRSDVLVAARRTLCRGSDGRRRAGHCGGVFDRRSRSRARRKGGRHIRRRDDDRRTAWPHRVQSDC